MRVLIISGGEDTGGVGIGMVQSFRRHAPDWDVRFVRRANNYIQYPADIEWLPGVENPYVQKLWREADVIHHSERWARFDGWTNKPRVLHHHGSQFRKNPEAWIQEGRTVGAKVLASTLDLVAFDPDEISWLPNPYDLDLLAKIGRERKRSRSIRIAHAPTNRYGKSTVAFLAACARLRSEYPIEVDLIERTTWEECLHRKAQADIYYDQVLTAYGCNAIEAWGMGIPVVAGVNPESAAEKGIRIPSETLGLMQETWGEIPFMSANESTIYDALKALMDRDVAKEYADRGLRHVQRWHSGEVVVSMLKSIYESVL